MMMRVRTRGGGKRGRRGGLAAVELAVALPMLCFICMAVVDYSRLMHDMVILADSARAGAYAASTASTNASAAAQAAAQADASDLSPLPTVSTTFDATGTKYVDVSVSYTFRTLVAYPGIPSSKALTQTVRMAVTPP